MKYIFTFATILLYSLPVSAQVLQNPLGSVEDPNVIIGNLIQGILGLVGTLALVIFIYGGVLMMVSAGNMERVKKGRDTMIWAAIGLLVIFASYSITQYVLELIPSTNAS